MMPNPNDRSDDAHTYAHKCIYLRAAAADALLHNSLGKLQDDVVIRTR